MIANVTSLSVNPMFLRHDLLIELGRLEAAMRDIRGYAANDHEDLSTLEQRFASVTQTLVRLSA